MPKQTRCDFCGGAPAWSYPCKDFAFPPIFTSIGWWAACDQCHTWIENGEREPLGTVAIFIMDPDPTDPKKIEFLQLFVKKFHDGFFANRTGPAVPINKEAK